MTRSVLQQCNSRNNYFIPTSETQYKSTLTQQQQQPPAFHIPLDAHGIPCFCAMIDRDAEKCIIGKMTLENGADAVTYGGLFCYHFANGARYSQLDFTAYPEYSSLLSHCEAEDFKLWHGEFNNGREQWKMPKLVRYYGDIKLYAPHILPSGASKLLYPIEEFTSAPNLKKLQQFINLHTERSFNTVEHVVYGKGMKISKHSDTEQILHLKAEKELLYTVCLKGTSKFTMEARENNRKRKTGKALHLTHQGSM